MHQLEPERQYLGRPSAGRRFWHVFKSCVMGTGPANLDC